ncbi:hypothetical protein [Burkholderia sp. Se-20373]|uniref:hypothetical protein n=1 Tax=Burkholderia sp. Se-20373 TaxID=2703898 RepID=UPI001F11D25F|nr:hypothetical protein [Burkholderia sp. Se-20373]
MIEAIEKHLGSVREATAKAIATATGLPQVDVSKTLHKMIGVGAIEREKRAGGGNEYVYWLAGAEQPTAPANDASPPAEAPALVSVGLVEKSLDPNASVIDVAQIIAGLRADVERLTAELDAAQLKAAARNVRRHACGRHRRDACLALPAHRTRRRTGAREPRGRPALEPDRSGDRPRRGEAHPLPRGPTQRRAAAHRGA